MFLALTAFSALGGEAKIILRACPKNIEAKHPAPPNGATPTCTYTYLKYILISVMTIQSIFSFKVSWRKPE